MAAVFLHIAGQEAIDMFNTFRLTSTQQKDYNAIIQKFEVYCTMQHEMFERYVFCSQIQHEDEPIEKFLQDVQTKAETCKFGSLRDSLIRDWIVCGTKDRKLKARLCRERKLTLSQATDFCKAAELD